MAHMADDGTPYTNRPQMVQHNARMAAKKSKPHTEDPSKANSEPAHEQISCPQCGAKFELHPASDNMSHDDNDAAGDTGF